VNRNRTASEARKWVVWIKTSESSDRGPLAFEKWLLADRENWLAYMRACEEWSRWARLGSLLSQNPDAVEKKLATLERKRVAARTHRECLWIALGVSVLALLLA
jgi:ferric-dicitrate binding protein FerR (iron transport regulator)